MGGESGGEAAVMTSSIGLLAAFGNIVVLLALVAAVARPRVSHLARLVIATLAFAFAWLMTAVCAATRTPDWTMFMGGAVLVMSIVVVIASLHLWTLVGDGAASRPARRGDEGGGGPQRQWPDAPRHGGGGSEPSWWPEFERRLAAYIGEREVEPTACFAVGDSPAMRHVGDELQALGILSQ